MVVLQERRLCGCLIGVRGEKDGIVKTRRPVVSNYARLPGCPKIIGGPCGIDVNCVWAELPLLLHLPDRSFHPLLLETVQLLLRSLSLGL